MSPEVVIEEIQPLVAGVCLAAIVLFLLNWVFRRLVRELTRLEPMETEAEYEATSCLFEEQLFSAVHPSSELGVAASPEGDDSRAEGRPCISSTQDVWPQKADGVTAEGVRAAGASSARRSSNEPEEGVFEDFPASGPVQDGSASDGGRVVTFSEESAQGSCASDLPISEGAEFSRRGQPGSQHGKEGGE